MIPKPFDPRLITELSMAVAKAAMDTGVAVRPIKDWDAYKEKLQQHFARTTMVMRPIFAMAKEAQNALFTAKGKKITSCAYQMVLDEKIARPIVIGRREVVTTRIKRLRLRMKEGEDFELVDPQDDPRYKTYWEAYHRLMERKGVTPAVAKLLIRTSTTAIGALMVHLGDADAIICGTIGEFRTT